MLSPNQVVDMRKYIEELYADRATVTTYQKTKDKNGATKYAEQVALADIPCRLSFERVQPATQAGGVTAIGQGVTLYTAPEHEIPAGSRITVTRCGELLAYKLSGYAAKYPTHQELRLELFRGWA